MSSLTNWLQRTAESIGATWRRGLAAFSNARRRAGRKLLPDFVVFTLDQTLIDLAPDQPWWMRFVPGMQPPLSIRSLHEALRRVADDPDVRGVVIYVKGATLQRTHAQNLAALFGRFHAWDRALHPEAAPKTIHLFLEQVNTATYLAACAADRIYVTPLTTWEVIGMRIEAEYYRDALARLGVRAEVVKVAPWKTAADSLAEPAMTPAAREQYEWLLDSLYTDMVETIARGRELDTATVRNLIDGAPWSADQALAAGLIDAILYEDELSAHLALPATPPAMPPAMPPGSANENSPRPARLKRYNAVRGLLYRHVRPRSRKAIGLLDLSGSIVSGPSRSFPLPLPLLGSNMLGSSSVQQTVRAARRDDDLAAVVAYVDSPGGSALASDIMWRELTLLAQEKPLVIYMGPVAASGGYYIAASGGWIMAQAATLTGSIGVITARIITGEAYAKLSVGRDAVQRGENADIYATDQPWSATQRAKVEEGVEMVYGTFKARVAGARNLSAAAVDAVAGGRVWTGAQALDHGLVDALGDLPAALEKAAALAGMAAAEISGDLRVTYVDAGKGRLLAQPLKQAQDAAALAALLPQWQRLLHSDHRWLLADGLPKVE
jgi:protease-4